MITDQDKRELVQLDSPPAVPVTAGAAIVAHLESEIARLRQSVEFWRRGKQLTDDVSEGKLELIKALQEADRFLEKENGDLRRRMMELGMPAKPLTAKEHNAYPRGRWTSGPRLVASKLP